MRSFPKNDRQSQKQPVKCKNILTTSIKNFGMTDESQKNFSEKSQRLAISLFIVRIATITELMAHLSSLCMWRSFSFFVGGHKSLCHHSAAKRLGI
jgi:hypothetical protein